MKFSIKSTNPVLLYHGKMDIIATNKLYTDRFADNIILNIK